VLSVAASKFESLESRELLAAASRRPWDTDANELLTFFTILATAGF
jgi:hypothetical protein